MKWQRSYRLGIVLIGFNSIKNPLTPGPSPQEGEGEKSNLLPAPNLPQRIGHRKGRCRTINHILRQQLVEQLR